MISRGRVMQAAGLFMYRRLKTGWMVEGGKKEEITPELFLLTSSMGHWIQGALVLKMCQAILGR